MQRVTAVRALVVLVGCLVPTVAPAQNDWQFPDPYFGALELGRSAPGPADEQRYRAEIDPSSRPRAYGPRQRPPHPGARPARLARPHHPRGRPRGGR